MTGRVTHGLRAEMGYTMAYFGAHLAFIPLFALLLPRRIAAVDPDNAIRLLSVLLLAGGVTASVAHIAAGRWSDIWMKRHGSRRGMIAIGVLALAGAQLVLAVAASEAELFVAVIAFQLALNLMFAPLGALLADHVADRRKGRVAGWLNATLPLASLGTALAAFLFPRDGPGGFLLIATISGVAMLPLLLGWSFGRLTARDPAGAGMRSRASAGERADYVRLWAARLLVQLGAAFVINYFFLYLVERGLSQDASRLLGSLAALATVLSFASALAAGYWSDRSGRRRPPMIAASLGCAIGLMALAASPEWPVMVLAFILFHVGLTAFLSVDSAMVTQLLSNSERKGELLGIMNLTNTFPSILVPALTLLSLQGRAVPDWSIAFAVSGILALAATVILSRIKTIR